MQSLINLLRTLHLTRHLLPLLIHNGWVMQPFISHHLLLSLYHSLSIGSSHLPVHKSLVMVSLHLWLVVIHTLVHEVQSLDVAFLLLGQHVLEVLLHVRWYLVSTLSLVLLEVNAIMDHCTYSQSHSLLFIRFRASSSSICCRHLSLYHQELTCLYMRFCQ